jgi:hypothetical protein
LRWSEFPYSLEWIALTVDSSLSRKSEDYRLECSWKWKMHYMLYNNSPTGTLFNPVLIY